MANHDPLDIQGQEAEAEERSKQERMAAKLEDDDLKWLANGRRGRRIIYRTLSRAGVFRLSFNTNAMTMAFNEGMRNEGLRLMARLMEVCPENYTAMLTENRENV